MKALRNLALALWWRERRARAQRLAASAPVGLCNNRAHTHNRRSLTLYSPHPEQRDCYLWVAQ